MELLMSKFTPSPSPFHTGFPENLRDHLAAGWENHYWALLKEYAG